MTGSEPNSVNTPHLEIAPELFEKQLQYLKNNGYQTISIKQMVSGKNESSLPAKPVIITFDDGTLDFWEYGYPLLEKYGFKASIFVVTDAVGKKSTWDQHIGEPARDLMNWDQLRKLHSCGYEICSHSASHRPFQDLETEELVRELNDSKETIKKHLGIFPDIFAYPKGLYKPVHKELVKKSGYIAACAVILHWKDLLSADKFEIKRMTIRGTESMLQFRLRLVLAKIVKYLN
jgi:peptidoglycan/xylan/chitin deacetylase (PgdA/CDA1 family)